MEPTNKAARSSVSPLPGHNTTNTDKNRTPETPRQWPQGWDLCTCCSVWFANPNGEPECIDCRSANRGRSGRAAVELSIWTMIVLPPLAVIAWAVLR